MIRKIICWIFFVISLLAIISLSLGINSVFSSLGITINFATYFHNIQSMTIGEMFAYTGSFFYAFFEVFGLPVSIFLISLLGISLPTAKKICNK